MRVEGARAVVVGGASGMARGTAEELSAAGARVAILDLPSSAGKEVASGLGGDARFVPVDITDEHGVEAALDTVVTELGGIEVAVNTPGGGIAKRTLSKSGPHPLDDFRKVIDFNLIATFNLVRLQAERMSRNEPDEGGERGVIINTSSIAAFEGQIGQVAYTAAKAAIAGMTLTVARDLGGLGIRCMAIAPSLFSTGLTAMVTDDIEARLTAGSAFPKRMGKPEEYARLARAIVETPMLNGSTIRLDGGQRFQPK